MPFLRKQKIVLHISSDENDRYLVKRTVKAVQPALMIRHVADVDEALEFLHQAKLFNDLPCLIIMDAALTMNGRSAFRELRKDSLLTAVPIVVFYSDGDDKGVTRWGRFKVVFIQRPPIYKEMEKAITKALAYCS